MKHVVLLWGFLILFFCGSFTQHILTPKALEAYIKLTELAQNSSLKVPLPKIAVIGVQSAGKTTFIETYIGFRVGFTARGTGTRCPVRYTLINKPTLSTPLTYMHGSNQAIPYNLLANRVAEHMKKIENTVGFTEEFLEVTIESSLVPNIQFVDVPGVIPEGSAVDQHQRTVIENILAKVARDPSYLLVTIVKATEDPTTITDLTLIDAILTGTKFSSDPKVPPPRMNWKEECIIITNKFNIIAEALPPFIVDVRDANDYFSKSLRSMYFVNLAPKKDLDRDLASFDDVEVMLKDFPILEANWIAEWKSKLNANSAGKRQVWNEANDQLLGTQAAKSHINQLWIEAIKKNFPQMLHSLEADQAKAKAKLEEANLELNRTDLKLLRKTYSDYAVSFLVYLKATMTSSLVPPPHPDDEGDGISFLPFQNNEYNPSESFSRTFEEDLDITSRGNHLDPKEWAFFIPIDNLLTPDHLMGHRIGKDLEKPLYGNAAVDRLKRIFSYFLIAKDFDEYSDVKIYNLAYDPRLGVNNQFPTDKVVIQMAQDQINKAKKGIDWFLDTLVDLYSSYKPQLHEFLVSSKKYNGLKSHIGLKELIDKTHAGIVSQRIERIKARWKEDTMIYTRNIPVDITVRSIMGTVINPLENILISDHSLGVPPPFEGVTMHLDKVELQGKYNPAVANQRVKAEPNNRVVQKRDVIDEIRKVLYTYGETFSFADFVDGGLAAQPVQEWDAIDYNFLRYSAREYYFHVITRLIFNLEAMLNHYFLVLVTEDPEREIQQSLLANIYSLTDDEISDMSMIDPKTARQNALDAQMALDQIIPLLPLLKQTIMELTTNI